MCSHRTRAINALASLAAGGGTAAGANFDTSAALQLFRPALRSLAAKAAAFQSLLASVSSQPVCVHQDSTASVDMGRCVLPAPPLPQLSLGRQLQGGEVSHVQQQGTKGYYWQKYSRQRRRAGSMVGVGAQEKGGAAGDRHRERRAAGQGSIGSIEEASKHGRAHIMMARERISNTRGGRLATAC